MKKIRKIMSYAISAIVILCYNINTYADIIREPNSGGPVFSSNTSVLIVGLILGVILISVSLIAVMLRKKN